jgi:hypothetical protein
MRCRHPPQSSAGDAGPEKNRSPGPASAVKMRIDEHSASAGFLPYQTLDYFGRFFY